MDDLIQIIAILVILALSGLGSLSKKTREGTDKSDSEIDTSTPVYPTSRPPAPPMSEQQRKNTYERQRPEQPDRRSKPEYQPIPARQEQTTTETLPRTSQEPPWAKMLKELLDIKEPEIVTPPPKPKKLKRKAEKAALLQPESKPLPQPVVVKTSVEPVRPKRALPPVLRQIIKRADREPLRSAVLLSEILNRPRAVNPDPWDTRI